MNVNEIPIEIEQTIANLEYCDLSKEDKHRVLQYISKEDYAVYRKVILESKQYYQNSKVAIAPKIETKKMLLAKFGQKTEKAGFAIGLWQLINFRIPSYQVAAALVLVFAVALMYDKQPELPSDIVYLRDTVEVIKTIEKIVEVPSAPIVEKVFVETEKKQIVSQELNYSEIAETEKPALLKDDVMDNMKMANSRKYSRSLSDDSSTFKYMVSTN